MIYFAYGSNLHPRRLAARLSSARLLGTGSLRGRRLAFHKRGRDGSGKCDAPCAEKAEEVVFGALYELGAGGALRLDAIEGRGAGYERQTVLVETTGGVERAFIYVAQEEYIEAGLRPFDWYKELVLRGALLHGFPDSYVQAIAAIDAVADPQPGRAEDNLAVLE